jgi:hypothetical protein
MNHFTTPLRRQILLALGCVALATPLCASAFTLSIGGDTVQGSGKISKQARQVPHFTGVALGVPGDVQLHIGTSEGVSIETDDNLQPLVETVVENGVLHIRTARENLSIKPRTLHVTVDARDINELAVGGPGSIQADDLHGKSLSLKLGGSGTIQARSFQGDGLSVKIGGSGNVSVGGGAVDNLNLKFAGSGKVNLGKLKSSDAIVKMVGSGDATVWATNTLNVKALGSGDVTYYGDPKVIQDSFGSSAVRHAGSAPR